MTKTYAIHPAIGVARLGNAAADPADASTYYLGAESPYEVPNAGQPYKSAGKIKKQAQRFRVYEYDAGVPAREITLAESDIAGIKWTVHLANRKPALDLSEPPGSPSLPAVAPPPPFTLADGPAPPSIYWPAATRNAAVASADRATLCIDAGAQTVGGSQQTKTLTGSISFPQQGTSPLTAQVTLGTLYVEPGTGRLLVFAGDGISQGVMNGGFSPNAKLPDWGNNDNWYDDTADGAVSAAITFKDGTTVAVNQPGQRAWVITAAPRYAPPFNQFTSIRDVAMSVVADASATPTTSFAQDIYPILRSVSSLGWLSARGSLGHGVTRAGDYASADRLALVSDNNKDPNSDPYKARQGVLKKIRNPNVKSMRADLQNTMPQVSHDLTDNPNEAYEVGVITRLQYAMLQQWAAGNFVADGVPSVDSLDSLPVAQQPAALDRAALECTAGTPFYPGIESWRILAAVAVYASPLRIGNAQPGDLTIGNALPWQADFLDCNDIWWPVQRPNEVTRDGKALREWVPNSWINIKDDGDYHTMVLGWWGLGFVVTQDDGNTYVEVERNIPDQSSS